MTGKGVNVGNGKDRVLRPGGTADSFSLLYFNTCNLTLKGAEQKRAVFDEIETRPVYIRHGVIKQGRYICRDRYNIARRFGKRLDLFRQ